MLTVHGILCIKKNYGHEKDNSLSTSILSKLHNVQWYIDHNLVLYTILNKCLKNWLFTQKFAIANKMVSEGMRL